MPRQRRRHPQRRLRAVCTHLRRPSSSSDPAATPQQEDEEAEAGDEAGRPRTAPVDPLFLDAPPFPRAAQGLEPAAIVRALESDGAILLPEVIPPATAAELAAELASYTPGTAGTGLVSTQRERAPRIRLPFGSDMEGVGRAGRGEILMLLFNRHPRWLSLLDPSPIVEAVDLALRDVAGREPHVIGQAGWRHHPGHDAEGSLHVDETMLPELPPELLRDHPGFTPPMSYITALTYLTPIDASLCPTYVVCGSHRACRAPREGEITWEGAVPQRVLAEAGDTLLLRSDVRDDPHALSCATPARSLLCHALTEVAPLLAAGRYGMGAARTAAAARGSSWRRCTGSGSSRRSSSRISGSSWTGGRTPRPRHGSAGCSATTPCRTTGEIAPSERGRK